MNWQKIAGGLVGLILVMLLVLPNTAQAHPIVTQTEPADGDSLSEAPGQLSLNLNEPVLLDFTSIEVVDSTGKHFTPLSVKAANPLINNSSRVVVELPALPPEIYRVSWKTRSQDDFHISSGSVVFGVQRLARPLSSQSNSVLPAPLETFLRWLASWSLAGLVGALELALLLMPLAARQPADAPTVPVMQLRLLKMARIVAGLTFLAGAVLLGIAWFDDASSPARWWSFVTGTPYGLRWLVSLLVLIGMIVMLARPLKILGNKPGRWLLAGLVMTLISLQTLNSHHLPGGLPWLKFLADEIHTLSASIWVGGLIGLALLSKILFTNSTTSLARAILGRFSLIAVFSAVALIITGLYKSGELVASLDGLLTTVYGQVLLFKLQLVGFAGLIGLFNAALLHPGVARYLPTRLSQRLLKPRYLRRALRLEVVVLSVVLLLASFLTLAQPPRGPEFEPAIAETGATSISQGSGDLLFNLSVKPNRPGQNFLNVNVYNTRRPAPSPFEMVTVRLNAAGGQATTLEATPLGDGRYQLAGEFIQNAGNLQISVNVKRPGLPDIVLEVPWKVLPATVARRPVVISNQPLAPWLDGLAIVLLLIGVGGLLIWLVKRWLKPSWLNLSRSGKLQISSTQEE